MKPGLLPVLASALAAAGCSSTPRAFEPLVVPPPVDASAFNVAYEACRADVVAAKPGDLKSGRATSGAGGVAAGYGAATALGTAGTYAGAALAMGALFVGTPLAIWGVSRAERARKERNVKARMAACLEGRGYHVADWKLAPPPAR